MNNESEFELDGKLYVANQVINGQVDCLGCAFSSEEDLCMMVPYCGSECRDDGRNVIFVEKKP